ncbi:alpha/beta hydrolase [Leptolyngbya ohadii]|uniref:alpha/beta hydrolase n=1 Tax=Leptolyngbya ohadii TaxID=1962290 RepID=UPI000B59C507|nr:alpha/beta hydrolase [Leptolyngbya ohadii]
MTAATVLLSVSPARSAETIHFQYGLLERTLQVRSLEEFAETGEVNPELRSFFDFLKVDLQKQQEFRQILTEPVQISPVLLSQFFYTGLGAGFLTQFGSYIRTEANNNGFYALRSAIILAAGNPEGLSLLNVLREYPTNMRVDVAQSLSLSSAASIVLDATDFFTQALKELSETEAQKATPIDFSTLTDLTKPGRYEVTQQRWQLQDTGRDRSFYVDLYQPQQLPPGETPVIILSHGLASNPEDFADRARYLVSYGFFVAVPQHPGSDTLHAENLLQGLSKDVFVLQEFIDRPLDIRFLLDELERRNQTEFAGRLNLRSVGVMGHSFGGYTALTLAGATIDFEHLRRECSNRLAYVDVSLFLQCRALDLPQQNYDLSDPRVTAVYAMNPVNNSIFGPTGLGKIQVPVMLESGSLDPVTPAIFEQVRSFDMLTTPNKYLAVLEGQAHVDFADLDTQLRSLVESVSYLTLPHPELLNNYSNALALAFFEVSLMGNQSYQPYLNASYAEYLSRDQEFGVFLVSGASSEGLKQYSREFRSRL